MPELQVLNTLKEIFGLGAGAVIATVIIAMFLFLRSQDKTRAKAEELDAKSAERLQDTLQSVFNALTKAQDNKLQLDKVNDAQDTALVILQNHSIVLQRLPQLVKDFNDAVEAFHQTQSQMREADLTTAQHMVDFIMEQKNNFSTLGEKVDTVMDSNARLVILLERLNANLERLNTSLELLGSVSTDIQDIKGAILKTVTSEEKAVHLPDESETTKQE